ncbi:MAG: leucine-rich repeat domain-containing protein [Prevotella sp.]|nr:leucine-rich repeat domain-containing protein [Prevotella sp.]
MTKIFNSDHSRRAMFCTLLSLLMWMVGIGGASAGDVVPRNPIVKIISGPTYSDNGTEVSLRLWMYNYDGDNAYFINDVYLTIDGSNVVKLNGMWSLFSNTYNEDNIKKLEKSGNVGRQGTMMLNGEKIGTAQFCNVKKNQMCAYNDKYKEDKWTTVELKLSFNNSFSYRPHNINVKGKWRDRCDDKKAADTDKDISNKIYGFLYPLGLTAERKYGDIMRFNWDVNYVDLRESMKKGKWVLYKKLKGSSDYEIVGETNEVYIDIKPRDFVCGATYYITFNPDALSKTPIISGLTASLSKEHWMYNDHCNNCKHYFFRYTTSDEKMVKLADNLDFGAKMLSNTAVGSGEFMIEFYDDITRIPDKAFYMSKLNGKIDLPMSVKSIGAYAFTKTACTDFFLPDRVTEIGEGAFESCYNFRTLNLPRDLKKIGPRAFKDCLLSGHLDIAYNVTEIGDYAFSGCTSLTKLTLTSSLQRIGAYAFSGCKWLDCELAIPSSVTEIGDGAFKDCTYLSGKLILPANLKKIGSKTFQNCKFFTNTLVIPNSVTEIGQDAFSDCSRFTGLSLPNNLRKIEFGAFARCINLSGPLSIPETVKEIGSYAFYNCPKFTGDFILPSALESIGTDAFANTQDKNRLVFQSLPKGMQNGYHDCKMRIYVNLSDASYVSDDAYAYLDGASYVRTMTNTWGSLVLPYDMLLPSDAPYSVFTIEKMTNDEVVLKRCTFKLMPGVAYIVRRDGEEKTLTFSPDRSVEIRMKMQPTEVGNLKFSGTYQAKEVTDGYILAQDRFWNVAKLKAAAPETQAVMVGPFRSWLEGTTANTSPSLSMRIGDSTTGIDNVAPLEMLNANDAEYYDLNGKRLDAPMKGVNIVKRGNKTMKVIIK